MEKTSPRDHAGLARNRDVEFEALLRIQTVPTALLRIDRGARGAFAWSVESLMYVALQNASLHLNAYVRTICCETCSESIGKCMS